MVSPVNAINKEERKLKELGIKLNNVVDKFLNEQKHHLDYLINTLKLVNPLNILSNGYSLVKKDDVLIKNSNALKKDDLINIKLHKGAVVAKVKEIKND